MLTPNGDLLIKSPCLSVTPGVCKFYGVIAVSAEASHDKEVLQLAHTRLYRRLSQEHDERRHELEEENG